MAVIKRLVSKESPAGCYGEKTLPKRGEKMNNYKKKQESLEQEHGTIAVQTARAVDSGTDIFSFAGASGAATNEFALYDGLRAAVPVIDAAISKIVRLTGGFAIKTDDTMHQTELDDFVSGVRVGLSGRSLHSFIDGYLDSLLTYGNAVGEMLIDPETLCLAGLYNGDVKDIEVKAGRSALEAEFYLKQKSGKAKLLTAPNLILFSALNPPPASPYGVSILKGLPAISAVLMRIYQCIGQNFDRVGNVRYAVTYKPQDGADKAFSKERALQLAAEWTEGMTSARSGQVKDFIAIGDVEIKVIGAENQLIDTNIPVRQLLEQIVAKLGIPPFLLGLNWTSTERMSAQLADILTSELEFYRRILTPTIVKIATSFLRLLGSEGRVEVVWDNINLQDEVELADARLKNAQARQIEILLGE